MTVWRVLCKAGMKKIKPTRKPGLTKKNERREACILSSSSALDLGRLEECYLVR